MSSAHGLKDQTVTLTVEQLAALLSSGVLTGVRLVVDRRRTDASVAAAEWVKSAAKPEKLEEYVRTFRAHNREWGIWIAYVAKLLGLRPHDA